MTEIESLLNIDIDFIKSFPKMANLVIDLPTEKKISNCVRRLKKIEEDMYDENVSVADSQSVKEILDRLYHEANGFLKKGEWNFRELRIVAYYIGDTTKDEQTFKYGLSLLKNNWFNLYLSGLTFFVLNAWNTIRVSQRDEVCNIIREKLSEYDGLSKKFKTLKDHGNMLEANGPLRLASLVLHRNEGIQNAPAYLGYKESALSMSYFSDVIVNYLKSKDIETVLNYESIFERHDVDRTKKLVLCDLVEKATEDGSELTQNRVSQFADRILGDITNIRTWAAFINATPAEVDRLKNAHELVTRWYARKVIEVFFERCVQDPARKEFWLNVISVIRHFKVYGSTAVYNSLKGDERVSGILDNYFKRTNSINSTTSALVLLVKNKIMVEFSDSGALYAYDQNNTWIRNMLKAPITNVGKLKLTSMPTMASAVFHVWECIGEGKFRRKYSGDFSSEGRLMHTTNWQGRLEAWFVNQGIYSVFPGTESKQKYIVSELILQKFRILLTCDGLLFYYSKSNKVEFARGLEKTEKVEGEIQVGYSYGKHNENMITINLVCDEESISLGFIRSGYFGYQYQARVWSDYYNCYQDRIWSLNVY